MKRQIIVLLAALMALLHCSDGFVRDNPWDEGGENWNGGYWTLTISTFPSDGGTVSASTKTRRFYEETSVTLEATVNIGYEFTGWSGALTSASPSITITMDGNKTLTANFYAETFVDSRDNKEYRIATIGTQTWMAKNLNYDVTGSRCYDNSNDSCAKYGRLYDWSTAMGIDTSYNNTTWNGSDVKHQGVCPVGWHLPTDDEWTTLADFVGSSAGKKLKSSTGWNDYGYFYFRGTDEFEFSGLPGGIGVSDGDFNVAGYSGRWWSATENDDYYYAWYRVMVAISEDVGRNNDYKTRLISVRCVAD